MKVWVLIIDDEVYGVFKNAQKANEKALAELYHHACDYNYPSTDYKEAFDDLVDTFNRRESSGFFGTSLLDWEISVVESELS